MFNSLECFLQISLSLLTSSGVACLRSGRGCKVSPSTPSLTADNAKFSMLGWSWPRAFLINAILFKLMLRFTA